MWKLKITEKQLAIAKGNGLSRSLVYYRVRDQKMTIEEAINSPKQQGKKNKLENLSDKIYSCRLPISIEDNFLDEVKRSGKTLSDFIATAIIEYLDK